MKSSKIPSQVREAWHRLGTPDAISWASIWVVAFLFIPGAFGANVLVTQGRELIFLVVSASSVIALGCSLWIFRWLITLIPRVSLRPWATLVAFESANVVRAWIFDELFVFFDFGDTHRLAYRILTGQISGVLGLLLAGLLVPYARAFSRTNRNLNEAVRALNQSRIDAERHFDELRESLTARVRRQLSAGLAPLTGRVAEEDARTLRYAIDDVVRPLSHQLAWEMNGFEPSDINDLTRAISWRQIWVSTLRSNPIRPLPTLLWVGIVVTQVSFIFQLRNALLGSLVSVCLSAITLYLARWTLNRLKRLRSLMARASIVTLTYVIVGLLCSAVIHALLSFDTLTNGFWMWACAQSIALGWAITLLAGTRDLFDRTNQELESALDALHHHIASTNGASQQLQKDVSRIVHGPIQDAITVALRKVESLSPGEQLSEEYIVAVRAQIDAALASLTHDQVQRNVNVGANTSLRQMVSDLGVMWSDSVHVTFTVSPIDEKLIDADKTATGTLFEVIREACSNAIRHGDARVIAVAISCDPKLQTARAVITNDGAPLPEISVSGLGSRTMTDLTVSWSRTQINGDVVIDARIPLNIGRKRR